MLRVARCCLLPLQGSLREHGARYGTDCNGKDDDSTIAHVHGVALPEKVYAALAEVKDTNGKGVGS
jgi:hypothetical protein